MIDNDSEAEYQRVEEKARTSAYEETRRAHPKVERKLGEVVRHHAARRSRFQGLPKVLTHAVLTALVVNVKRMVKWLAPATRVEAAALPVRAALVAT